MKKNMRKAMAMARSTATVISRMYDNSRYIDSVMLNLFQHLVFQYVTTARDPETSSG